MKLLILKGLPGSGKTTYAKDLCETNKNWVRINRDDLRNMRGVYWLPKQEDMITDWELKTMESAFSHGYNVVMDSTNLNPAHCSKIKSKAKELIHDIQIDEKFFDISPEECIKRDLKRPNSVGADVIWGMYEKYINVTQTYKEDRSLPHAIICDIDGTLADNNGRNPFEWSKVGEDKLNDWVCSILIDYMPTGHIILLSGRDSICEEITVDWLKGHGVPFDYLYMRPKGNSEKDSIIKKRLFENHIRGKFYIDYVIDDRDQVVRMWRKELGLNVLQCNYGNF